MLTSYAPIRCLKVVKFNRSKSQSVLLLKLWGTTNNAIEHTVKSTIDVSLRKVPLKKMIQLMKHENYEVGLP